MATKFTKRELDSIRRAAVARANHSVVTKAELLLAEFDTKQDAYNRARREFDAAVDAERQANVVRQEKQAALAAARKELEDEAE